MIGRLEPPVRQVLRLQTSGPDDTRELAAVTANALRPGDVVSLTGELGAGKTCFVQGAASALGVPGRITSPTFTLVRSYRADRGDPVEVVHVDVYRLDRLQDVIELGEETVMGPTQITFIEWGDAVEPLLPADRLEVELLLGRGDLDRHLRIIGYGRWSPRMTGLALDLARWAPGARGEAC